MGFAGIRSLSILLSLSLVLITAAITVGLSVANCNDATTKTEDAGRRGISATKQVCTDGFDSLRRTSDEGLAACFGSGEENAEYLGGLMMEQTVQQIEAKIASFFETPYFVVAQTLDYMSTFTIAEIEDQRVWSIGINRWLKHTFNQAHKKGLTGLTVYTTTTTSAKNSGISNQQLKIFIEAPDTIYKDLTSLPEGYSKVMTIQTIHEDCNERSMPRAQCQGNGCPWCVRTDGSGGAYCGHPRRTVRLSSRVSRPCEDGYAPLDWTSPWTATRPDGVPQPAPFGTGISDETGQLILGSCGLDKACGCEAAEDVFLKLYGTGGSGVGTSGYNEPHVGSYKLPNGSYPARGTVGRATLLEPGACQLAPELAGYTAIHGYTSNPDLFGDIQWTPVGGGTIAPLLPVKVYASWTRPECVADPVCRTVGYVNVEIDVNHVSQFMKRVELPGHSRMYAVQTNPWIAPPAACKDDQYGLLEFVHEGLAWMGLTITCEWIYSVLGGRCQLELFYLFDEFSPGMVTPGNVLGDHCPALCGWCPRPVERTVGQLIGATHGAASVQRPVETSSYADLGLPDLEPLNVWNSSDPVIRDHGSHVLSLPGAWATQDPAVVHRWLFANGSSDEDDVWWTKFRTLTTRGRLGSQLHIHIVLLVKRSVAMRSIIESTAAVSSDVFAKVEEQQAGFTRRNLAIGDTIKRDQEETDEEREDAFWVMIGVCAAVVIILMITSVVFVNLIVAPLLELVGEMADVAKMNLEGVDMHRRLSILEEVKLMQRSFLAMVSNLIEYRNYMPASILVDSDVEDDDSRDGPNELSIGSVTLNKTSEKASPDQVLSGISGISPDPDTPDAAKRQSTGVTGQDFPQNHHARHSVAGNSAPRQSPKSDGSRTTKASKAQKKAAGAKLLGPGLEQLKRKQVTFLMINVRHYHQVIEGIADVTLRGIQDEFLTKLLPCFRAAKGVPDTFSGDRIMTSFNGVKACPSHKTAAASASTAALEQVRLMGPGWFTAATSPQSLYASSAIVTGDSKCGNLGCVGMKRFTFLSPALCWGWALERLNNKMATGTLIDPGVWQDVKSTYIVCIIDTVDFVKRSRKPIRVYELMGGIKQDAEEWMYQLEGADKKNPYNKWNTYAEAVFSQKWDVAKDSCYLKALAATQSSPSKEGSPLAPVLGSVPGGSSGSTGGQPVIPDQGQLPPACVIQRVADALEARVLRPTKIEYH